MITSTLLYGLLALSSTGAAKPRPTYTTYSVVPGIFQQDDPATDAATFNFTAANFGLIARDYPSDAPHDKTKKTQWQRLAQHIKTLNKHAPKAERYALLFLGRHGEGYHNAAESYLGTPAWNCYWSELDGNGTHTWADAKLTTQGVAQALLVKSFWAHLLKTEKITPPQSFYTSPLWRCLDTARLTFTGLALPPHAPFTPIIKENFREGISAHTCDRRRPRSAIHAAFPTFRFERNFAETDPYWRALFAEQPQTQDVRSKVALDDVFATDRSTVLSVTSHSGEIASLLRVLGHREFRLATGASLPVLVKVTAMWGEGPPARTVPAKAQRTCAVPPTIRDSSCNDCLCCL
ncbi:phosphoglycerate mutase family protein [Massariosphaeria phaeospora]|uniref:Phosphoglycerate mutase family protein n=1 Tax=Massariosphaeria phaeospora TaxID=100035 RepID=A0A7C8IDU9_9PLEO|nr:phosphoglycerate mutase family protein [Massariosphaeria phaeospora]